MAKKSNGASTALVPHNDQLPATWEEELARDADAAVAAERTTGGGNFISIKGGHFSTKGEVLESPIRVIVLDSVSVNAYYTEKFNPDKPATPVCYAVDRDPEKLAPTNDVPSRQNLTCSDCWANAFGSGDGKGKACKNGRKLALVSAMNLNDVTSDSEVFQLNLPPTSLKFWAGYVKKLKAVLRRPPWGVVTELEMQPSGGAYVIAPHLSEDPLLGVDKLTAVKALRTALGDELLTPTFRAPDESEKKAPARAPVKAAQKSASRPAPAAEPAGSRPTAAGKKKF